MLPWLRGSQNVWYAAFWGPVESNERRRHNWHHHFLFIRVEMLDPTCTQGCRSFPPGHGSEVVNSRVRSRPGNDLLCWAYCTGAGLASSTHSFVPTRPCRE